MKIRIPEAYKKGFECFIALNKNLRDKFIDNIEKAKIEELSTVGLVKKLCSSLRVRKEDIHEITKMVFSLFEAKEALGNGIDSFVNGIIGALEGTGDKKLKPTKDLKNQLKRLISLKGSFYIKSKAKYLITEREKIFIDSNVLTDLRPLFGDKKDYKIKGSLIIHNLKIMYNEEGQNKEMYFALDNEDLEKLKNNILRAKRKEEIIKKQFKISKIPFIDIR